MEMWMVAAGLFLTQKRAHKSGRRSADWMDEGGGDALLRIAAALVLIGLIIGWLCLTCGAA